MNNIVERIICLIDTLGLSKNKFMQSIGCSHVALINWEKGNNIADKTLLLIEKTYNVNPDWLRNGEGEMFLNDGRKVSPLVNDIIKKIGKLDNENLLRLVGYIDSLQTLDNKGKIIGGG